MLVPMVEWGLAVAGRKYLLGQYAHQRIVRGQSCRRAMTAGCLEGKFRLQTGQEGSATPPVLHAAVTDSTFFSYHVDMGLLEREGRASRIFPGVSPQTDGIPRAELCPFF